MHKLPNLPVCILTCCPCTYAEPLSPVRTPQISDGIVEDLWLPPIVQVGEGRLRAEGGHCDENPMPHRELNVQVPPIVQVGTTGHVKGGRWRVLT